MLLVILEREAATAGLRRRLDERDHAVVAVEGMMKQNVALAQKTIARVLAALPDSRSCSCASALKNAIITERSQIPKKVRTDLKPIIGKYL